MIYLLIVAIIFGISFFFIGYQINNPKKIKIVQKNNETIEKNKQIEKENLELEISKKEIGNEIALLEKRKNELTHSVIEQKDEITYLLREHQSILEDKFDLAAEQIGLKYQKAKEDYQNEYLKTMKESISVICDSINEKNKELEKISAQVKEAETRQSAIIELFKKEQEEKDNVSFYKLQVPKEDIEEIEKIKTILPYLRDKEPVNKVIWKVYYEKPFSDLIGRTIGTGNVVSGIYKITNLENQMSYIGQSVNIKDRFRTHIKRGLGAETGSGNNKIYKAMQDFGVQNFSFEILEECPKDKLNEEERYWINYFKSQDYGYNETKGNK